MPIWNAELNALTHLFTCRDPEIFGKDADRFRPERFLNGEVNETSGLAGPYACESTFYTSDVNCWI